MDFLVWLYLDASRRAWKIVGRVEEDSLGHHISKLDMDLRLRISWHCMPWPKSLGQGSKKEYLKGSLIRRRYPICVFEGVREVQKE
jgi:hypothetical protein